MSDLQEEQAHIDNEIVSAVIECTPEDNYDFELALAYVDKDGKALGNVKHILRCLDGQAQCVSPSDEVFNAVEKLNRLFAKYKIMWQKITYHIFCDEDDQWRFEADFVYGNEENSSGITH